MNPLPQNIMITHMMEVMQGALWLSTEGSTSTDGGISESRKPYGKVGSMVSGSYRAFFKDGRAVSESHKFFFKVGRVVSESHKLFIKVGRAVSEFPTGGYRHWERGMRKPVSVNFI